MTGQEGLGFGDVKLLGLLGIALGPISALNVLLLSSIQGAIIGIVLRIFGSEHEAVETEAGSGAGEGDEEEWVPPPYAIPFGPFLVLGALQVVLLPGDMGDVALHLSRLLGNPVM